MRRPTAPSVRTTCLASTRRAHTTRPTLPRMTMTHPLHRTQSGKPGSKLQTRNALQRAKPRREAMTSQRSYPTPAQGVIGLIVIGTILYLGYSALFSSDRSRVRTCITAMLEASRGDSLFGEFRQALTAADNAETVTILNQTDAPFGAETIRTIDYSVVGRRSRSCVQHDHGGRCRCRNHPDPVPNLPPRDQCGCRNLPAMWAGQFMGSSDIDPGDSVSEQPRPRDAV